MNLEPGVVVADHFQLESLIGTGGMGAVWKAKDLRLGRVVALKVLHTDLRSNDLLRERFQREARLLASIEHPAIVPIYDWIIIEDDNRLSPGIVMPFIKGRPLSEAMARNGIMSVDHAVTLMRPLVEALAVAHEAGVVHRDLKPQNVVLEDRAGVVQLKLLDFGIAKSVATAATASSVLATRAGMLLGTPEYMSPEQIRDPSSVDGRADLWAAAVCFYEMLTTRRPFESKSSSVETIAKVMVGQFEPPSKVVPSLPPSIDAFFVRAFSRNIDERPRTAQEMLAAIVPLSSGSQIAMTLQWNAGGPNGTGPHSVDTSLKNPGVLTPSSGAISYQGPPSSVDSLVAQSSLPPELSVGKMPTLGGVTTSVPEYFGSVGFEGAQQSKALSAPTPMAPPSGAAKAVGTVAIIGISVVALSCLFGAVLALVLFLK